MINSVEIKRDPKDQLKKELLAYAKENEIFFDIDKVVNHINQIGSLGALKKYKIQIEEKVGKSDKKKYENMDHIKQDMFEIIAENNLFVGKDLMQKIAHSHSKRELRYLMLQVKEKYNLSLEDLERTHKSIYAILTPMGNQMR